MSKSNLKIRMAKEADAEELLQIYAPYVQKTAITFEYEVPTVAEFADRIRKTLDRFPYLVAVMQGEIVGYAYASPFKERKAYDWAIETSVYIRQDMKRMGIGRRLHEALEKILRQQNILNMNACIAYPSEEDEYLTEDSVRFHERLGYQLVGKFHKCGYKFNRWYDMVWMEKIVGEHLEEQSDVIPCEKIAGKDIFVEMDEETYG